MPELAGISPGWTHSQKWLPSVNVAPEPRRTAELSQILSTRPSIVSFQEEPNGRPVSR